MHPDRIVVGVDDKLAEQRLREVYAPLGAGHFSCPIHSNGCPKTSVPPLMVTRVNSAELIKHACNSFLALKISYANLIAEICEGLRADVDEVIKAMASGPEDRAGFPWAGPGIRWLLPTEGLTGVYQGRGKSRREHVTFARCRSN